MLSSSNWLKSMPGDWRFLSSWSKKNSLIIQARLMTKTSKSHAQWFELRKVYPTLFLRLDRTICCRSAGRILPVNCRATAFCIFRTQIFNQGCDPVLFFSFPYCFLLEEYFYNFPITPWIMHLSNPGFQAVRSSPVPVGIVVYARVQMTLMDPGPGSTPILSELQSV